MVTKKRKKKKDHKCYCSTANYAIDIEYLVCRLKKNLKTV